MKARLKNLTMSLDGGQELTLALPGDWRAAFNRLKDADVSVEIKKWRERRSLTQNAYAWALIGKIAESMRPPLSKDECYQLMLKRYGQNGFVSIPADIYDLVIREIDYYEHKGTGTTKGKEFVHIRMWVGSSKYDRAEMALFLEGIISEAKELDIETLPPHELARMEVI